MRDRCFRTVLMSEIGAPDASSALVSACLSAMSVPRPARSSWPSRRRRRGPARGRPAPASAASASTSAVPARPACVRHRVARLHAANAPQRPPVAVPRHADADETLRARSGRHRDSAPRMPPAMCAPDLPQASTISRPAGGGGRCGGRQTAGCARATAASNIARQRSRGFMRGASAARGDAGKDRGRADAPAPGQAPRRE